MTSDKKSTYAPIPSLKNKYEINRAGTVRNAKTKHPLRIHKIRGAKRVYPVVDGVKRTCYISSLKWEVHGTIPKHPRREPIPCTAVKGTERHSFKSLKKCAAFIAEREFYSQHTVFKHVKSRKPVIFGWKIFYREPEKRVFKKKTPAGHPRQFKNKENRNESNR